MAPGIATSLPGCARASEKCFVGGACVSILVICVLEKSISSVRLSCSQSYHCLWRSRRPQPPGAHPAKPEQVSPAAHPTHWIAADAGRRRRRRCAPGHAESWEYYQITGKVHAKVLQNLMMCPWPCSNGWACCPAALLVLRCIAMQDRNAGELCICCMLRLLKGPGVFPTWCCLLLQLMVCSF